jgi:hypothetical protein
VSILQGDNCILSNPDLQLYFVSDAIIKHSNITPQTKKSQTLLKYYLTRKEELCGPFIANFAATADELLASELDDAGGNSDESG